MTVTAQLSATSASAVTVPFSITGTATNGTDFTITASPITIAAGNTTGSATVTITGDATVEPNETVILTMGTPTNATQGATTVHTATITNDDVAVPTVQWTAASQASANESGTMTVTAQLSATSASAVTVPFTVTGTATSGTDYTITASPITIAAGNTTGSATITITADATVEPDETVILTMGTPTNATQGATTVHTATITNDDAAIPTVQFTTASQASAAETGTMTVTAQLSATSASAVTVPFTLTGTATNGTDYTITASPITIAAGNTTGTATITITADATIEPNETVILTMGTPTNATQGATTVHTATITNDDAAGTTVQWTSASQLSAAESGTMTVTAQLSQTSASTVTVPFTISGTATNGTDYTITASPISITAGNTTGSATITITTDVAIESNETVILTMGTPTNATASGTTVHTASIRDDDATFNSPLMHNANNTASTRWGGTWGNNKDCTWCHTSGSTNVKQVALNVTKLDGNLRPVYFQRMTTTVTASRVGIFGDDSRTYDVNASRNVCEVCHHQTQYHQYSSSKIADKTHYNRKDCISCHSHDKAFKASCGSCHLATPTSGSHPFHAVTKSMDCATCHFNSVGAGATHNEVPSKNSLGFMINNTNVPGWSANSAAGTFNSYSGANTNSSQANTAVPGVGVGSCNVYCHGNWPNSGGTTNARWTGGPSQAACGTCHGATNALPPLSNAHAQHAGTAAGQYSLACASCHGTLSTAHINGTVVVTLAEGTYSRATGLASPAAATAANCSNTYCHSNGTNLVTPVANTSPNWGTTITTCGVCHATPMNTGSHAKHITTYGYTCDYCHAKTASNNTTIISQARHANRFYNVSANTTKTNAFTISAGNQCSNTYCHSNGRNLITPAANTSVAWGGTAGCTSCHVTLTSAHDGHVNSSALTCDTCHTKVVSNSTTISSYPRHANKFINVSANTAKTPGFTFTFVAGGASTCSNTRCHGGRTETWSNVSTNDKCTTCHGATTTVAITAANRDLAAPPMNVAGVTGTLTGTGQVSSDPKVGAHQTHLKFSNGLSEVGTIDDRCMTCHGILPTNGVHANATALPAFTGLATHNGTMSPAPSFTTPNCSNTYCHNPAGTGGSLNALNAGTGIIPVWTNAAYIADAPLKTQNNCNKCHKSPGDAGFTSGTDHSAMTIAATSCTGCHEHDGGIGGTAGRKHMDGVLWGGGNCDSCHDYDTVGAVANVGGYWGKSAKSTPNGYGAHAQHINYIKTRLGIVTALNAVNQTYGAVGSQNRQVCGSCHTVNNGATDHTTDNSSARSIYPVGHPYLLGAATLVFGPGGTLPAYNTSTKTCSNLSCHYFTTPSW